VLSDRAAAQRDDVAFVQLGNTGLESERLTFGDLDDRVRAVAARLLRRRLGGERLLLLFPPGLDFVVALFVCFRAGAVAVPMPNNAGRRTADRIAAIARDAQPAAILTIRGDPLAPLLGLPSIHVDDADDAGDWAGGGFPDRPEGSADDLALMQYTSGSTSRPKGVMLSHANLLANSAMIAAAFGHDRALRGVGWLPLYHDMGLIGHVLQPVFVGGLSVLMPPLSFLQRPQRWLETISTWRATTSGGPSQAYALCLRHVPDQAIADLDLRSWRVAYCGSEPVDASTLRGFADRFAVSGFDAGALLPCYGLAEASLLATSGGAGEGLAAGADGRVSCGRPWGDGTVAIVDPDTGAAVADGGIGEICVSGANVASGYWNDPDASARAFCVHDGVRRLRTGDLGRLHDGTLHVHGRIKDILIVMGSNYAAEDIEAAVTASDGLFAQQGVAAFATLGSTGERAIVVQEVARRRPDEELVIHATQAARTHVLRALGLRVDEIVLVRAGSLPRTSSGKIQRGQVRTVYEQGGLARLDRTIPA